VILRRASRKGFWIEAAVRERKDRADAHARRIRPLVEEVRKLGIVSHVDIAAEFNRRGVATAHGARWHAATVRRVILRGGAAPASGVAASARVRTAKANAFCVAIRPAIEELKAAGITLCGEIARELNRRGLLTPTGQQWSGHNIGNLRKRVAAIGIVGMSDTPVRPCVAALQAAADSRARRVLPAVAELRAAGIVTLAGIGAGLRQRGISAPRGGLWHRATVRRLLARRVRMRLPEGREAANAPRRQVMADYMRRLVSIIERLIGEGFNTAGTMAAELNRRGELSISGARWNVSTLGITLRKHAPEVFEKLRVRSLSRAAALDSKMAAVVEKIRQLQQQGVNEHAAVAEELNRRGLSTRKHQPWTKHSVISELQRAGLLSLRAVFDAEAEARRRRIVAAFDGMARHGIKGAAALAQEANRRRIEAPSGGEWTAKKVIKYYAYWGRKLPKAPPVWSAEDIGEMIELKRAGWTRGGLAAFFRTTLSAIDGQLKKHAKTAERSMTRSGDGDQGEGGAVAGEMLRRENH
jgi:hypothetical protein